MRKKKIYPFDIFNYALLILFAIVTLYPFWYVIIGSVTNGLVYELGGVWPVSYTHLQRKNGKNAEKIYFG